MDLILRQGGWHFPSVKRKDSVYLDFRSAYRRYLAGSSPERLADEMERFILLRQWESCRSLFPSDPRRRPGTQWLLYFRDAEETRISPLSLPWNQYQLEPCCRFLDS
ncbi:MAG: hypothetical protein J6H18_03100, partial [Lachnospiraceae bacterium]|nr:hypothetical protein [Lachnospiraceae bacterium]